MGGKMMVGPVFLEAKQAVRELASTQDAHLGYYTTVEVLWCKKSEKRYLQNPERPERHCGKGAGKREKNVLHKNVQNTCKQQ